MKANNKFPVLLFSIYVLYYAGQALQSGYESLFLSQNGLQPSQIGTVTFAVTIGTVILQTVFGNISDSLKKKNRMIQILYLGSFIFALLLTKYQNGFLSILVFLTLFMGFFSPLIPLSDDYTVRSISQNSKYDYGSVRMGGTIGYAMMMLTSGYILNDDYHNIFLLVSFTLVAGGVLFLGAPAVTELSENEPLKRVNFIQSLQLIAGNRTYLILITMGVLLTVGESLYGSYYSIYYLTIGGNSRLLGIMQFVSAISEVPCLLIVGKVIKKMGTGKTLALSAVFSCARWILLYATANPIVSIYFGLLHGFGFAWSNYCLVNYTSKCLDEKVRASGQVFRQTISLVLSRAVFGYLGGILYEAFGAKSLLLISAVLAGAVAVFIWVWSERCADADVKAGML